MTTDFGRYEVGELLEYDVGTNDWKLGTLLMIDTDDPGLPWAISTTPLPDGADEEDIELAYHDGDWQWWGEREVRPATYLIEEVPV